MGKDRQRYWLLCSAALAAGLVLRLWFVEHMACVAGDTLVYGGIAKNWMLKGVYGFYASDAHPEVISPTLIRLPGYPLFLMLCFRAFGVEHYRAVMNVQIAVDLGTCLLASGLVRRLFGDRAALVTLWATALCPFTANYVAAPLTETLVLATIALAFYGFVRWADAGAGYNGWLWVIAAALAYSLLLRPEQGLLGAAVLPAMLWQAMRNVRRRGTASGAGPVLIACMLTLLPLVPWTVRNWTTFKEFQPLAPRYANDPGEIAPEGFARWYRTWATEFASTEEVYWNYNGDRINLSDLPARAFDAGSAAASADLRERTAALLDAYNVKMSLTPQIDGRFGGLAMERVHAHPVLYYLALPLARLLDMALRPRTEMMDVPLEWWRWREHPGKSLFAFTYAGLNLVYLVAGFAGIWLWIRRSRRERELLQELALAMVASVVLRSLLLLTIDNSEPRYTLEFFPVLFVGVGALVASRATLAGTAGARSE